MPRKRHARNEGGYPLAPRPGWVFGVLVAEVFVAVTGLAVVTGHWQNGISRAEYQHRFERLDSPVYKHFRGHVPQYGPND